MTSTEGDIRETYNYLYAGAKAAIDQGGSFVPFGAAVRLNGDRTHMGLEASSFGETVQDHIGTLVLAMREDAEKNGLRAVGLVFDGQVTLDDGAQSAAIVMHIEVFHGESLEAFVPYVREPGTVSYFPPIFAPTDPSVFPKF
jgi:hypothetical protein